MFYGIMAVSTENNKSVERSHVEAEFVIDEDGAVDNSSSSSFFYSESDADDNSYDMSLTNLNNYQYNIVKNYNNSIVDQAAAESFYIIVEEKSYVNADESTAGHDTMYYDLKIRFSDYETEEAYERFMDEYINGTLVADGIASAVHYTETDLIHFEKNIAATNATFGIISAVLLAVSVFLLVSLYNIRINQYKFTYGVYMTVGADFKGLFATAFWELFLISLVTYIPAIISSTVVVWLIYRVSGFAFRAFLPGMWILVGLFSLVVVTISVISPMRIMSMRTPMSLIRTEDNSNLVSSPRRSFNILGKKFPAHYEIYSIWRFRKYNIQLLTSAIAFCALFIVGLYLGKVYDTSIEFSKPQYTLDFSDSRYYYNAADKDAGIDGAIDAQALLKIEGITGVEQTGDEKGGFDYSTSSDDQAGSSEEGATAITNFSSPQTEAEYISSYTSFPTKSARFLTNFLNDKGAKATNEVIYKAIDRDQLEYLKGKYTIEGTPDDVLKTGSVKYCIVGDSISNMQKFNLKEGDTITIYRKTGQLKDVDSNASGRSLLKQQLKYFEYEGTEFVICAVIKDIPSGSLPIYILGDDYQLVTGINPDAQMLNVYTEPGLDTEAINDIMAQIKTMSFANYGTVHVTNNRRTSLQSIASDEHNSDLYVVISVLILVISPLVWFFNQILYYRKREKEFNVIQSMGAKESDIRTIYLLGGLSMAVMSLVVSILLSYVASYVVYYFINAILPNLSHEFIRYEFYLPWYALVISAVVSVFCGFFSTYVPYKSYFKNRYSLENGGSGMKDDE